MDLYPWIKYLHIVLAIVAVGFNASYSVWLARAAREPEHQLHVLRGIKVLDDRFANPAYGLLFFTGLAMVFVGGLDLTTLWILAGIVLWVVVIGVGVAVYTPTLRRQIGLMESEGPSSPEYRALERRSRLIGILLGVIVVVIVGLMVLKPTL
jgi:uncharacterized membrane protein